MSYRCEICRGAVGHGHGKIVHVITREVMVREIVIRTEVAREVPVCSTCKNDLTDVSFDELLKKHAPKGPLPMSILVDKHAHATVQVAESGQSALFS